MLNRHRIALLALAGCFGCGDDGGSAAPDGRVPDVDGGPVDPPPGGEPERRLARENALAGTTDWEIERPAAPGEIEGYATAVSVAAGGEISIAVSTRPAGPYRYRVFRLGWYGGKRGRLFAAGGPLQGAAQPAPAFDPLTGLVEAHWATSFTLTTATGGEPWVSGAYVVKLEREGGGQSYAVFVVRDDRRDAEVALQLSTSTWQAYNAWGGESLYRSDSGLPGGQAVEVSYDRPYSDELNWGAGLLLNQEMPAIRWLEERGYDIEYTTNFDTGARAGRVGRHKLWIAVGHDEYSTAEEVDRLEEAVGRGTSLAFLTGNTMFWQVRYEDSPAGPERKMVGYKDRFRDDPLFGVDDRRVTGMFRAPPVSRPENGLLGVMSNGDAIDQPADWVVEDASHWVYDGTGLVRGDRIPGAVGFEWDGLVDNGRAPAGLVVLAASPVDGLHQGRTFHNATIYERDGAFVFAAGAIWVGRALHTDARLARAMENVLARAGARRWEP